MYEKYDFRVFRYTADHLRKWHLILLDLGIENSIHPCMNRDGVLFVENIGADASGVPGLNYGMQFGDDLFRTVAVNDRQFLEVAGPKFSRAEVASRYIVMYAVDLVRVHLGLMSVKGALNELGLDHRVTVDEDLCRLSVSTEPAVYSLTDLHDAASISRIMCMKDAESGVLLANGLAESIDGSN
ncbi:hypothetical protein [Nocardia sp. NPDC058666]|uniref:hypothetical protein n=1 Tax=Nocardia sp. NPDC058666 TaxID=3346587 RepID=UPI003664B84B